MSYDEKVIGALMHGALERLDRANSKLSGGIQLFLQQSPDDANALVRDIAELIEAKIGEASVVLAANARDAADLKQAGLMRQSLEKIRGDLASKRSLMPAVGLAQRCRILVSEWKGENTSPPHAASAPECAEALELALTLGSNSLSEVSIRSLEGKLLTLADSSFPDARQCKAFKDNLRGIVRDFADSMNRQTAP
jgi:hypothetical protein